MNPLTLYDIMAEDTYVFARVKDNKVEVEVLNSDDEVIFNELSHPYAWESLVLFAKQVVQLNKHIEKDLDK